MRRDMSNDLPVKPVCVAEAAGVGIAWAFVRGNRRDWTCELQPPVVTRASLLLAHAQVTCAHGARAAGQGVRGPQQEGCARGTVTSVCPVCCERHANAAGARAGADRTQRACCRAGCVRSAARGGCSRRAARGRAGLLRATRLRCSHTRRRRRHAARASPCRVRAFSGARGALAARGRPACCARRAFAAGARACDVRTQRACRRTGPLRLASRGSACGEPAAFRQPGLLRAARIRCWRTHRWRVLLVRVSPCRVLTIHRRARGELASDCPGCCERRASASGARAGDVCTRRTRPFAGCLRFPAGQVLSRRDGVRLS